MKTIEMFRPDNRRKFINLFIDKKAQLRFLVPFSVSFCASVAIIMIMSITVSHGLAQITQAIPGAGPVIYGSITYIINQLQIIGIVGIFILGLVCFVFWLVYSNRVFGPIFSIERQIKNLLDGKYDVQITLRKNDEFGHIADGINQLAKKLEAGKK